MLDDGVAFDCYVLTQRVPSLNYPAGWICHVKGGILAITITDLFKEHIGNLAADRLTAIPDTSTNRKGRMIWDAGSGSYEHASTSFSCLLSCKLCPHAMANG